VRALYLLAIFIICSSNSYGQVSRADTLARNNAIYLAKQAYQSGLSGDALVFNGVEYIEPLQTTKLEGNPYFLSDDWMDGFVFYDGELYENVFLRYDIFQNKLVIDHVQTHTTIELIVEKIKYFGLADHTFTWLANDQEGILKEGFYDLLYSGNVKVFAKRSKTVIENTDGKVLVTRLKDKTKLFLFKNGKYYAVSNKRSALNVFGYAKPEIKRFLSREKFNFRSAPEITLVAIGKYYDELKK